MTLILGMVCEDGVVIAADSKMTPHEGGKATYDFKKICKVENFAIAIAGVGYFGAAIKELSDTVRGLLRLNPNIPLHLIATEMCRWCANFLIVEEAYFVVLVADSKDMYHIQARYRRGIPEARFDKVDSDMAGIEDVKLLPYKGGETTKEYSAYFKKVIRLNKGPHVGGRTQVVILKK
jgi:hypothetical protein